MTADSDPGINFRLHFRELKARNETLETAVADDSKQRGILEVRLAEETQERQRLGLALKNAQSEGSASNQDVINALRSELKAQDTEIAEARKIKSRVKCALRPLKSQITSTPYHCHQTSKDMKFKWADLYVLTDVQMFMGPPFGKLLCLHLSEGTIFIVCQSHCVYNKRL